MIESVCEAHGPVDMDTMCLAELQMNYWAISRRQKLAAIHSARATKREHELVGGATGHAEVGNLAREGLKSVDAFRAFFASKGIPVIDAIV